MPVSTVYRFLRDLRRGGFVVDVNGVYSVGDRLSELIRSAPARPDLRRLARPTLERLADDSGETAVIAVRSGIHALCLDQVESNHGVRMAFRVGERMPLHAGAASRILLAYAPQHVVDVVMDELNAITTATPSDHDLPGRLAAIRSTGLATSRGELVVGAVAIAAPILGGDECVCSLGVAAPERRAAAAWQRMTKSLLKAARRDLEMLI